MRCNPIKICHRYRSGDEKMRVAFNYPDDWTSQRKNRRKYRKMSDTKAAFSNSAQAIEQSRPVTRWRLVPRWLLVPRTAHRHACYVVLTLRSHINSSTLPRIANTENVSELSPSTGRINEIQQLLGIRGGRPSIKYLYGSLSPWIRGDALQVRHDGWPVLAMAGHPSNFRLLNVRQNGGEIIYPAERLPCAYVSAVFKKNGTSGLAMIQPPPPTDDAWHISGI